MGHHDAHAIHTCPKNAEHGEKNIIFIAIIAPILESQIYAIYAICVR